MQDKPTEQYQNMFASLAASFLPSKGEMKPVEPPIMKSKKRSKTSVQRLAMDLKEALEERQWFVTGNIDLSFFSDDFSFEDPDVKIKGIEEYSSGVRRIFNQERNPEAEILSVNVVDANFITVTWRIRVWVNIAWGIRIRPYIIETDFQVDPKTGLLMSQKDRFTVPSYQILIPSLFPFLEPIFPPIP